MKSFRLTLAALLALAFALGGLSSFATAKSTLPMADAPCHMAASMVATNSKQTAPCKGLKADCVDQMGCITVNALPAQAISHHSEIEHVTVDYLVTHDGWSNVTFVPEPLPPRTI